MNAIMRRELTRAEVVAEPWKYDSRQWRTVHGIHIPWIAEISPMQVGMMCKQQRARYNKERAEVWQTSADGCHAWAQAVRDAFDAGKFEQYAPGVSDEANTTIYGLLQAREAEALRERSNRLHALNRDLTGLKVGDVVYSIMSREYATIQKLSAKSARIPSRYTAHGTFKVCLRSLQWLSHNDVEAQVKAGAEAIVRKVSL